MASSLPPIFQEILDLFFAPPPDNGNGDDSYKPPFPWFGGKSKIAPLIWERLGDVANYCEPFFGSGAMLFLRPTAPGIETVNDKDGMVSNFWRALQKGADAVARFADWPPNENDLHARHSWLVGQKESLQERLEGDPDFCDAKAAGWWVWGMACWIGGGFCSGDGPWTIEDSKLVKKEKGDQLLHAGIGVKRQRLHLVGGQGVNRQLLHLGDAGQAKGQCETSSANLKAYMRLLADRLRLVRVCCGDFERVLGPSPTYKLGMTGVFLDPPYDRVAGRETVYTHEDDSASARAKNWAIKNGDNPLLRIAFCGYAGEHDEFPPTWGKVEWKTPGGYANQGDGRGRANRDRERVWFSPYCLKPARPAQGDFLT